jgi:hypothetical protein
MPWASTAAKRAYEARRYSEVTKPRLATDPAFRAKQREHGRATDARRKLVRSMLRMEARVARRARCSAIARLAAIQMRVHQVMPDGDLDAFRERLLASMPKRVG